MTELAVDSTGRREDDRLDARLPHCLENVEGPHHTVAKIAARMFHAADDVRICGQVPDQVMSFDLGNEPVRVENICFHEFESRLAEVVLNELAAAVREIVVDGNPIPLAARRVIRNVAADEPGTAGNEDFLQIFVAKYDASVIFMLLA